MHWSPKRNWPVFISCLPLCPNLLSSYTTALEHRYIHIDIDPYLSRPIETLMRTLCIYISMIQSWCCGWDLDIACIRGKHDNIVYFLAQTRLFFMFLDLNLSSRATEFNLVLSVCVFLSLKVQLTCIIWLTDCNGLSFEETKSPTSWMLCRGWADKHHIII